MALMENKKMTMQSPGTLAVLLGPDLDVSIQIQWAVRLAKARKLDILILQRVESQNERVVEIPLNEPPEKEITHIIREVMNIIEESGELQAGPRQSTEASEEENDMEPHIVHVCFKQIYFTNLRSLRRLVLDELGKSKIRLFTLARKQLLDRSDVDLVRERRYFLRYIPCEVVLCQGLKKDNSTSRILVAAASGPNGEAALQLGIDLSSMADGKLTALHVNPSVGLYSKQVGKRRLDRILRKLLDTKHSAMTRRVVVDNQVDQGIRQVWEEGENDMVLVGAPRSQVEGSVATKLGKGVTVVIVSDASPIANRFKQFLEERVLQRFVPQIEREDRVALVDRVQSSAAWNFDFIALMVLSTTMAAIGLIQNSTAVVIGAMLVAPLMTPLLGLGLALVQGNPVLARLSFRSIIFGLGVSLFGGFMVGTCALSFEEPTREMLARGGPGLLDLLVAFAAGLAAAYASSRPSLIAALPGVAIAAALVPPIATSGLALSLGDFPLAIGALLLFSINMVTIVLASMTSLWLVGIRNLKKASRWTAIAGSVVIVSVLALGIYLSLNPKDYELAEEIPTGLVEAVQESLGTDYKLDSLAVAYDELGVQLNVRVVGKTPAPEELATEVRTVASDHYEQPVRVRLLTRIAIDVDSVK
jgi:uncharacterized hydrophobic protein (TIGR00271 family)